ncbi:MAG: hypothetical protein IJT75_01310 [Bacteroidaceae bacterium]|nr:hypothetical protein [Bacteroidaceae bacterium]
MEKERLKIKAELAAEIFNTLAVVDHPENVESLTDKVVRLTNGIIRGIENETEYTKVHNK